MFLADWESREIEAKGIARWIYGDFNSGHGKFCKYEAQYVPERQEPDWSIIPSSGKSGKSHV